MEGRDEAAEGLFVYAVRTTGVFCRPGCRSRRPLRANVEYFDTPGDALSAGYRACRRCRPDRERASDATTAALVAACRRFELDADESVVQVAREVGLSERHLRRLFTEVVGVPAGSYRRACREKRLRDALRGGSDVTTAAVESGYGSARALYDGARLGMTPGRYRDGGRGERIRFTSIVTPLGVVVAASSSRGVCWVSVGPREADLTKALAAEYPLAVLERDDDALADVARMLSLAASGADASRLPLDVQGTAFQIRVSEALRRSPSARPARTPRWRRSSGSPARCARWRRRARPTSRPSRSRVTGSFAATGPSVGTAGGLTSRGRCSPPSRGSDVAEAPASRPRVGACGHARRRARR